LILCDIIIIISGESRFESGGANPFAIFFPSSKHLVRSSCFVVATFIYLINIKLRIMKFLSQMNKIVKSVEEIFFLLFSRFVQCKSICHLFPIIKTFGSFIVLCGGYFCLPNKPNIEKSTIFKKLCRSKSHQITENSS
jgi:hypothetical protein